MAFLGGLFDAFTGDPAKEAAAANRAEWGRYRNDSLGFLDTAFGLGSDAINKGIGVYQPLAAKYGAATGLGMDALGVNGAAGNARAVNAFQAGPGFNFALNTGLDAIDRRAASRGMLGSGNTNLDTVKFAQGLANQEYGGWLDRLLGQSGNEMAAASGMASGYGGLANLAQTTGQNKVGVVGNAATGTTDANTAEAQARMQASKNVFDLGTNLLALGTGQFGRASVPGFAMNPSPNGPGTYAPMAVSNRGGGGFLGNLFDRFG